MAKCVKKVSIVPGCISCGTCEAICPNVFQVKGVAEVRPSAAFKENTDLIKEAADMCPVNVITFDEEDCQ